MTLRFYTGVAEPAHAKHVERAFVSVNRLRRRVSDFEVGHWVMDSGAFTEVARHGGYRHGVEVYASEVDRWHGVGSLDAAVAQDWMCEPFVLKRTGRTLADHQRLTVERYQALRQLVDSATYVMPVLQGFDPADYVRHVAAYGYELPHGAWVGVGSVCKRNGSPQAIWAVLTAIKAERPDLRLHGFGVKVRSLEDPRVAGLLYSADSMAWSFAARREGRNANDVRESFGFARRCIAAPLQAHLWGGA